jgi:hypothetical protein
MKSRLSRERARRLKQLRHIYSEIAAWNQDCEAVQPILHSLNPCSELAVVAEAVGPKTLRVSGVSYFDLRGRLGRTGKCLDEMLRPMGFTVYPPRDLTLASGAIIQGTSHEGRQTAYFTDICPEFPGHALTRRKRVQKKSTKRPSETRVRNALQERFLERELAIVRRKAILLLGSKAYVAFYKRFLKRPNLCTLGAVIKDLPSASCKSFVSALVQTFHTGTDEKYLCSMSSRVSKQKTCVSKHTHISTLVWEYSAPASVCV